MTYRPTYLRQIPLGRRFVLLRTREAYTLVRHDRTQGATRYVVTRAGESQETTLHPACHVLPILAAIKPVNNGASHD